MSEHEHEVRAMAGDAELRAMRAKLEELERANAFREAFVAKVRRGARYREERPIPQICATCRWCDVKHKQCPTCVRKGFEFVVAPFGRCDAYKEYRMDRPALELAEELFGFLMEVQAWICSTPPTPEVGRLERVVNLALARGRDLLDQLQKEA